MVGRRNGERESPAREFDPWLRLIKLDGTVIRAYGPAGTGPQSKPKRPLREGSIQVSKFPSPLGLSAQGPRIGKLESRLMAVCTSDR